MSLPDKPLVADALGAVADAVLHGNELPENTLVVTEHFESKMVTAQELSEYVFPNSMRFETLSGKTPLTCHYLTAWCWYSYTPLKGGKVQQRLKVRYHGPPATLVLLLRQMFDDVVAIKHTGPVGDTCCTLFFVYWECSQCSFCRCLACSVAS